MHTENPHTYSLTAACKNVLQFFFTFSMTTTSSTGTWRLKISSTPPHTASKWVILVSALNANPPTSSPPSAALRPTPPLNSSGTSVTSDRRWTSGLWASCCSSWWQPRSPLTARVWDDCASASSEDPTPFLRTCLTSVSMWLRARWGWSRLTVYPWRRSCPARGWGESSIRSRTHLLLPHLRTWPMRHGRSPPKSARQTRARGAGNHRDSPQEQPVLDSRSPLTGIYRILLHRIQRSRSVESAGYTALCPANTRLCRRRWSHPTTIYRKQEQSAVCAIL